MKNETVWIKVKTNFCDLDSTNSSPEIKETLLRDLGSQFLELVQSLKGTSDNPKSYCLYFLFQAIYIFPEVWEDTETFRELKEEFITNLERGYSSFCFLLENKHLSREDFINFVFSVYKEAYEKGKRFPKKDMGA